MFIPLSACREGARVRQCGGLDGLDVRICAYRRVRVDPTGCVWCRSNPTGRHCSSVLWALARGVAGAEARSTDGADGPDRNPPPPINRLIATPRHGLIDEYLLQELPVAAGHASGAAWGRVNGGEPPSQAPSQDVYPRACRPGDTSAWGAHGRQTAPSRPDHGPTCRTAGATASRNSPCSPPVLSFALGACPSLPQQTGQSANAAMRRAVSQCHGPDPCLLKC